MKTFGQRQILRVEMILIAGDISCGPALNLADGMREPVPDGLALPVFVPCALDLIGGGGGSPKKPVWKAGRLRLGRRNSPGGLICTSDVGIVSEKRSTGYRQGTGTKLPTIQIRPP